MNHLVLKPVISEKSFDLAAQNKYVFEVPKATNKIEVAREVAAAFKVTVLDVNIVVHKGKVKRMRGITGKRSDSKKAIVTLKKGDKIAAFAVEETK